MAKILFRTKGNANPKGKPRVYFTCHPADFDRYFEKVCEDIFKTQDCAIFYTEDMNAVIEEQDKATDLECHNLLIVPVTRQLLTSPNRAMDTDIPYALEKHIPVLPFLMEPGIDRFYAAKFGELQYLNPGSTDDTEIAYEEKLKKYLDSVLISDAMAKRIRAAFDAYIFLSYRKKDRFYANQLMRLIHSHPECRDIAIWYDEFLTPGESFRENIEKILCDSKLFALLVTPNLLEEPEGQPNFVMGQEYPIAKRCGIDILPTEMAETEKAALQEKFADLPTCVKPEDEAFHKRLLDTVSRLAITANDRDPMHNFLIGLAYLEGIDMETDRERGLALITSAAEQKLPEAMEMLFSMYHEGANVALSYTQAVKWAQQLADYYESHYGPEHPNTLNWLNNLALVLGKLGEYQKSLQLKEKCCTLFCKVLGEDHPDTLTALSNLAAGYAYAGNYKSALSLEEKVYSLRCQSLGEDHPDTLCSLNNLAKNHQHLGSYKTALALMAQVYELRCKTLGQEHPRTLQAMRNLGAAYSDMGALDKALAFHQNAYTLSCRVLGEEHPDTVSALNDFALALHALGQHDTAAGYAEKAYRLYCGIFGEADLATIGALVNLATIHSAMGNCQQAAPLMEKAYAQECAILGEEHPETLVTLNNLALIVSDLGDTAQALALGEKLYTLRAKVLGEAHPETLRALCNLASSYGALGEFNTTLSLFEKAYNAACKTLGQEHPDTLVMLNNITLAYSCLKAYDKEATTLKTLCDLQCRVLGEDDPRTQKTYSRFEILYRSLSLCRHCGGKLKGLFQKKCTLCGKKKDY